MTVKKKASSKSKARVFQASYLVAPTKQRALLIHWRQKGWFLLADRLFHSFIAYRKFKHDGL